MWHESRCQQNIKISTWIAMNENQYEFIHMNFILLSSSFILVKFYQ